MRLPPIVSLSNMLALRAWEKNKSVNPPSVVKQKAVIALAKKYAIRRLVETGTYLGDMVDATKKVFEKIDSIELSGELYRDAVRRFRKIKHIKIWNGDSAVVLAEIINDTAEPILFWLDAHYSGGRTARSTLGDTPIEKELDIIFTRWNPKSLILVDDARLFVGEHNYPTLPHLKTFLEQKNPHLDLTVENDIIVIRQTRQ